MFIKFCMQVDMTRTCMGSSKVKAQGQSQGHETSAFILYFCRKKTIKT